MTSEQADDGGFFIPLPEIPGMTSDQVFEMISKPCADCGCCFGTHWPTCPHFDEKTWVKIKMGYSVEECCRERGISEDVIKRELGDKYKGPAN